MKKLLLATGLLFALASPASAQNTTCSDRSVGDSSNACANTRFVQNNTSSIINYCLAADRTGATDSHAALQACIDSSNTIYLRFGNYKNSSQLVGHDNLTFGGDPGAVLQQTTRGARGFYGANLTNVEINDITFIGEGTFCGNIGQPATAACPIITLVPVPPTGQGQWLGDGGADGHNDRAIQLDGCTNCRINRVHTKNTGTAGIAIFGGNGIFITNTFHEGTNLYSTPITAQGNFQYAITLGDHFIGAGGFGAINNLFIDGATLTGTAQGFSFGNFDVSTVGLVRQITNSRAYNITGQHGYYGTNGNVVIDGFSCANLALACVKDQVGVVGYGPYNFTATGVSADTIGGNMFEIGVIFGTGLDNVQLAGTGKAANRGLSIGGPVRNLTANIQVEDTTGEAVVIQGDGPRDIYINVNSTRNVADGVLVSATNASNIHITPIIREPSTTAGRWGVLVASASADVILHDPFIADANGRMVNGISNSTLGSTIKVLGSANISGASGTCVSATGLITAWPIWLTLSCTGGNYTSPTNITPVTAGSLDVPFIGNAFFPSPTTWTFGSSSDVILTVNNGISITGLGNGLTVDGQLKPNNLGIDLGNSTTSWAGVYLSGATSGTGRLIPPAIAGTAVWTLPTATTTLIGTTDTATVTNKSISGSTNTLTNIANASLTNSSTMVNGQVCTLGAACTVTASAGTVTVGTTTVASGTTTRVLFDNAGILGEYSISGTGNVAMTTTPTISTPVINGLPTGTGVATANTASTLVARDGSGNFSAGTISAALSGNATTATTATTATNATNTAITDDNATNATMNLTWVTSNTGNLPQKTSSSKLLFNPSTGGLTATSFSGAGTGLTGTAASLTAGNVTTNANLTGAVTSVGNAASLGSFSSANLSTALTDETGSGVAVFGTSPTLSTVDARGTWTTGTSWTLPAFTLNGTITGGGNQFSSSTSTNGLFSGVFLRNTSAGNVASSGFQLQNDTASSAVVAVASSAFVTASYLNRLYLQAGSTNAGILLDSGGATNNILFAINNTEQARLQASGGWSIGSTTDPGAGGLQVNGQSFFPNVASDTATVDNTACIGPSGKLLKGTGALGVCLGTSSAKFKHDIAPMATGLAEIVRLAPKNFFYNKGYGDDGKRLQYGFIAEDVVKVIPGVTAPDSKGNPQSVDMLAMVPILVNAIKQLKADNDNLRMDVLALQAKSKTNAR